MRIRIPAALAGATLILGLVACDANAGNTGPPAGEEGCDVTYTDTHTITTPGVYDGICMTNGSLVIAADNVELRNSQLQAEPPTDFVGVFVESGSTGYNIHHNIIDCGGALETTPLNAASQGIRSNGVGVSGTVSHNEIRNCSDGIQLFSNTLFTQNWIHSPDNCDIPDVCDLHADGVQFDTEADGSGVTNVEFRLNVIEFPGASAAFAIHNTEDPVAQPSDLVIRYNRFYGGAWVVRFPGDHAVLCQPATDCEAEGIEFYGNLIHMDPSSFGLCSGGTHAVDVWGDETGNHNDSFAPTGTDAEDDDNSVYQTTTGISRTTCGG